MYDVREALDALPPEFDARQAAAVKLTTEVLDRLVRNNRIARVQPGIFRRVVPCASGDRWQLTEAEHRSRLRVALLAHPSHAASHISAALLYEWPLRLHPDALVHLTALDVQPRSRRSAEAFLH